MKLTWSMIRHWGKKHMPQLLLGCAIGGAVSTTVLTVYGTVKTVRTIDELNKEESITNHVDTVDKVKAVAKYWVAPAIMLGGTIFCICELNAVHVHKEAALAAMGAMWKNKYSTLEEEVKNDQKSGAKIKEQAVQKELQRAAQDGSGQIQPVAGTFLCWEPYSRQFFHATEQQLLWAELTANKEHATRGFLTLNDFLMLLPGAKKVDFGDELGWFPGSDPDMWVYQKGTAFIDIDTSLQHIDGQECAVLQYSLKPGTMLNQKYRR